MGPRSSKETPPSQTGTSSIASTRAAPSTGKATTPGSSTTTASNRKISFAPRTDYYPATNSIYDKKPKQVKELTKPPIDPRFHTYRAQQGSSTASSSSSYDQTRAERNIYGAGKQYGDDVDPEDLSRVG